MARITRISFRSVKSATFAVNFGHCSIRGFLAAELLYFLKRDWGLHRVVSSTASIMLSRNANGATKGRLRLREEQPQQLPQSRKDAGRSFSFKPLAAQTLFVRVDSSWSDVGDIGLCSRLLSLHRFDCLW